jgi:hypothetical protein
MLPWGARLEKNRTRTRRSGDLSLSAKDPGGLLGPVLYELCHVSVVEVRPGFARKRGVALIIDPKLVAVDCDRVDGRMAAMLPVGYRELDGRSGKTIARTR